MVRIHLPPPERVRNEPYAAGKAPRRENGNATPSVLCGGKPVLEVALDLGPSGRTEWRLRPPGAVDPGAGGHAIPQCRPLRTGYATRKPLTGSAPPAAPRPHAPSTRAYSRSSEPAGRHARSRAVPRAAAPPPPARCERSMPASSIPQTWCPCLITLPHLGITGSRYNYCCASRRDLVLQSPAIVLKAPHRVPDFELAHYSTRAP
jgi:hypothetical protein